MKIDFPNRTKNVLPRRSWRNHISDITDKLGRIETGEIRKGLGSELPPILIESIKLASGLKRIEV